MTVLIGKRFPLYLLTLCRFVQEGTLMAFNTYLNVYLFLHYGLKKKDCLRALQEGKM